MQAVGRLHEFEVRERIERPPRERERREGVGPAVDGEHGHRDARESGGIRHVDVGDCNGCARVGGAEDPEVHRACCALRGIRLTVVLPTGGKSGDDHAVRGCSSRRESEHRGRAGIRARQHTGCALLRGEPPGRVRRRGGLEHAHDVPVEGDAPAEALVDAGALSGSGDESEGAADADGGGWRPHGGGGDGDCVRHGVHSVET